VLHRDGHEIPVSQIVLLHLGEDGRPEFISTIIRDLSERRLTAEELDAYVNAPMSDDEREGIQELITWFRTRYPRPLDRIISSRRAYRRLAQRSPPVATAKPRP